MVVEIFQLQIIPFEKRLQSINDVELYTPKVIVVAAFRPAIYHFLLVACCYHVSIYHRFLNTTTFEVNVIACDLVNSFIFDNDA